MLRERELREGGRGGWDRWDGVRDSRLDRGDTDFVPENGDEDGDPDSASENSGDGAESGGEPVDVEPVDVDPGDTDEEDGDYQPDGQASSDDEVGIVASSGRSITFPCQS